MAYTPTNRPFTDAIRALRAAGARYTDLVNDSNEARSSAWFNTLVNSTDPWAVSPPGPGTWKGLASLIGSTETGLREMLATEWFCRPEEVSTMYARAFEGLARDLTGDDVALVLALTARLANKTRDGAPAKQPAVDHVEDGR